MGAGADFLNLLRGFSDEDWRRVYDSSSIGWTFIAARARGALPFRPAEDNDARGDINTKVVMARELRTTGSIDPDPFLLERFGLLLLGADRSNFLSYVGDKLHCAIWTIEHEGRISDVDFAAGLSPFIRILPAEWAYGRPMLADLLDATRRGTLVSRYETILSQFTDSTTIAESLLPSTRNAISVALCLESIGVTERRQQKLADDYLALCNFLPDPDVHNKEALVLMCQQQALRWLGHEYSLVPTAAAPIGSKPEASAVSSEDWFVLLSYAAVGPAILGLAVLGVVVQRSASGVSNWAEGLTLLATSMIGGTGAPLYRFLERRTTPGTVGRLAAKVSGATVAVLVPIGALVVVGAAFGLRLH